jgi:hypothetical protein
MLYRCLLRLHPAGFRKRFAGEMLWIFDEAAAGGDARGFFLDGAASLARQWLLRGRTWIMPAAIAGATLQILVVLGLTCLRREPRAAHAETAPAASAALAEPTATGAAARMETKDATAAAPSLSGERGNGTGIGAGIGAGRDTAAGPAAFLALFAVVLFYARPGVRRAVLNRTALSPAASRRRGCREALRRPSYQPDPARAPLPGKAS